MTEGAGDRLGRNAPLTDISNASPEMDSTLYEFVEPADPDTQTFPTESQSSVFNTRPRGFTTSVPRSDQLAREGTYERVADVKNCALPSSISLQPTFRQNRLPVPTTISTTTQKPAGQSTVYEVPYVTNEESSADDSNTHTYGDISDVVASEAPVMHLTNNPAYGEFSHFPTQQ